MTNFPKKVFTDEDYSNSLENLGLVPSAVIMMSEEEGEEPVNVE